ncbi:MAG: hypothetical protein HY960_04890 [Ignavibacteriae bacterium]|nr:hypothetical protein [Ignavibacteriota bacterium]
MGAPNEVVRIYKIDDAKMLEISKEKHAAFTEYNSDFQNYNIKYKSPYGSDWLADITAAEATEQDSSIRAELTGATTSVKTLMTSCGSAFQLFKPFVLDAFPNNLAKQKEFGFDDYEEAIRSQPKLILFMKKVSMAAVKYTPELLAANCTQARIDELASLHTQLDSANTSQEVEKDHRTVEAQDRILLLNKVWERTSDVANIGKLLYANDYARYQRFVLYGMDEEEKTEEPPAPPPAP